MSSEAARVLDEWRRAERLLTVLPDNAPERIDVELHLAEMRELYQRLTGETQESARRRLEIARREIARTHVLLNRVAERYRPLHGNGP